MSGPRPAGPARSAPSPDAASPATASSTALSPAGFRLTYAVTAALLALGILSALRLPGRPAAG
ncbi:MULTISPECIES: hypothetical protein [Streptomyces]|uniref:hypothetical protein n=1 Tax=Streptomyces TaxID=1883 RepID=UPI0004BCFFD4|nr:MULTISPECIES: hypothetical protein [Streptomyces]